MFIYLSQRLGSPILIVVLLWYFSDCFPLAFLEGYYLSSSLEATSLYLDSVIWNPLVSSSQMVDLVFLLSFTFIFIFFSVYFPIFLFLEQLGLGLIGHTITTVT